LNFATEPKRLLPRPGLKIVDAVIDPAVQRHEVRPLNPRHREVTEGPPGLNPVVLYTHPRHVALLNDGPFAGLGVTEELLGLQIAGEGSNSGFVASFHLRDFWLCSSPHSAVEEKRHDELQGEPI